MHITWHGLTCVKIQTTNYTLLINPFQESVGVAMPKFKADIVVSTDMQNEQTNNLDRLQGNPFHITNPGEYEKNEITAYGIAAAGQTIFAFENGGITFGHLGLINSALTDAQLEYFEGIEVLFLPISSLTAKARSAIISQIEPRVIIPMQYKTPKFKPELESLDAFCKEMGVKNTAGEPKIILKKKDLPVEETQTMILQPS